MNTLMRRWFFLSLTLCLMSPFLASSDLHASEATIFIYHRFGEARYPSTNIDVDLFAEHMQYLKKSGKLVLPLAEVVKHLEANRDLPPETVVLTVDDAFDSFLENALPILRQHNYPVTLFVNSDGVGSPGYLDWEQLRGLIREGVAIGNHSATHDYLLERKKGESHDEWRERVVTDINRAQNAFESELGIRPDLFAYPYGEYSPELIDIVKNLGFRAAVAQQSGVVSGQSNLFSLPRFPMGGPYASLKSFSDKAEMHPFDVAVVSPNSPVVAKVDPPELKVRVLDDKYDLRRLQGFVQGDNQLQIEKNAAGEGTLITVRAVKPLTGRRNKYTLTVPLKDGSGWAWYSFPWFRLDSKL